jgi:glycosyltransferase involved in cell wall biosynthesis/tetratricopeptide (TPR) repeat protein
VESSKIQQLHLEGSTKYQQGDLVGAIECYREAIELDPASPAWLYSSSIVILARSNDLTEALALVDRALVLYPNSDEVQRAAGVAWAAKGNVAKSRQYFQQALVLNEKQPSWVTQKLDSLNAAVGDRLQLLHRQAPQKYQQGDLIEAWEAYHEAIELDPTPPEWIYSSAITIAALLGNWETALELGSYSLTLHPKSDEIHRAIAVALEAKGDLASSLQYYQQALALNSQQPDWVRLKIVDFLQSVSLLERKTGEVDASIQHSQQANQLDLLPKQNREKMAVIAWDLGHNPAGRAYLLADMARASFDVELIGALFPAYGQTIWSPIANTDLPVTTFPGNSFAEFIDRAIESAQKQQYDVVYVSKPRFPSLCLGLLIAHYSQCPLILDIDDCELSFAREQSSATLTQLQQQAGTDDWNKPYGSIWTRFAANLILSADAITVSNLALQQRYGGTIVRHARDETVFNPQLYDRHRTRHEFGYNDSDRVILFLGTPRPHKGIFRIAEALETLNDPSLVLCIIGTITDPNVSRQLSQYSRARIDCHRDRPWSQLPQLVNMADLVCILQEPNSPITEYQIPAKLTDAIALGIPVIVSRVPPLADVIASGAVIPVEDDNLAQTIRKVIDGNYQIDPQAIRLAFAEEFSYRVNYQRIKGVVELAKTKTPKPLPDIFISALKLIDRQLNNQKLDRLLQDENFQNKQSIATAKSTAVFTKERPYNILFFWKQNDSDLYGRRQDRIVHYLAQSDRINKIIHFDAPISARKLQESVQFGPKAKFDQSNFVFTNTVSRSLGLKDTNKIIKRTFIYRDEHLGEKFLGRTLPPKADYPDFVRQVIQEAKLDRTTIAWVCPTNFEFLDLHREFNFEFIVADLIDDQRKWQLDSNYARELDRNYQEILSISDVVFANCQPLQEAFGSYYDRLEIVPNGADLFVDTDAWTKPEELANLSGKVVGYVGNLSDRLDLELLKYIATTKPQWNLVLIGSAHRNATIFELIEFPNIHLLGVKPYDEAVKFIKYFDVAIVPHVDSELTRHMNPLKLYVYFALGVPIVSSTIANIEEFAGLIYVASDNEDFVKGIELASHAKSTVTSPVRQKLLQQIDWQTRVNHILQKLDEHLLDRSIEETSNNFAIKDLLTANKTTSSNQTVELSYAGVCNFCGTQQIFYKHHRSLREGYQCCQCKASLRYRGQAAAILQKFATPDIQCLRDLVRQTDFQRLKIYEPGLIGAFRQYFADLPNYINSYFWQDVPLGEYRQNLQCQSLENLTYSDFTFDLIITSDILEHIRRPWQALSEIWRVLKPGGYHIFTVPVTAPMPETTVARVDTTSDRDIHLLPPKYHSAPIPEGGRRQSLVYTDFGSDLVNLLKQTGFAVELLHLSPDNAEIGRLITFVTQKR